MENDIRNEEDLFFLKDIIKKLESIADAIYRLRESAVTDADIARIRQYVDYLDTVLNHKTRGKELQSGLERITGNSKDPVVRASIARIHELCRDVLENFLSIEFDRTYFLDDTVIQNVREGK